MWFCSRRPLRRRLPTININIVDYAVWKTIAKQFKFNLLSSNHRNHIGHIIIISVLLSASTMEPAKKKSVIAAIKLLAQQMGRKSAAPAPVLADAVVDAQGSHASVETTTKPLHSPFVPTPEYVIGAFLSRVRFNCDGILKGCPFETLRGILM